MSFLLISVVGQLGHDVMNELLRRGCQSSDIRQTYSSVADGSVVTKAPYVALDITDKEIVEKVITEANLMCSMDCR
mgnify:CR=1 FL=1